MSKSTKSLAYNTAKKRKIIIGCAIGGTAVLMMGAGIGIGYAIKQTTKQDTISFGDYRSALNVGDQETISPVSSIGKHFTINATGSQPDNWTFDDNSNTLTYDRAISGTEPVVVTITANDGVTQSQTNINLLPATIEPPFPADAFHINSTNAAGCLIYSNTEVYTNQSATLPSHNTLLDLVEFRKEKNITTDDFVIDGIVNFGILVGFDENINLYGSGGSLMNVVNQTTNAYGIVVGSISGTGSSISYTGTMNIDNSVHCNISSSADAYGVYFYSINADSAQTINGVFTISSSSNSSNAYACGVYFNSTAADSTQTINGVFTISSSNSSNAYAYGVQFYSTVSGDITVNGVFTISSSSDSSNAFAHGVSFSSIVSGDITVNGTFTISSYSSNSLNADAYGVYFYSITVNADSTQTINGVFTISSSGSVHGVHFQLSASSCDTTINGVFTLSALTVTGVYFLPTMSGKTTINGVFTISASSTTTSVYAIGVGFLSTVSGDITINGVFTISSSSSSSSSASASGVYFERTPSGKLSGVPKFCSNKIDSGDWISQGKSEYWNGIKTSTAATVADDSLALQTIYDNKSSNTANFWVKINGSLASSQRDFVKALVRALQDYISNEETSNIATTWIRNIINQINIPPYPEDAYHIDKDEIPSDCLIPSSGTVYADNGVELPERNVLLDLAKFKVDKGITDQVDFVIDGTIDFGILVGFDENIYLYGETDSLMDINVTTNAFGIVVGSQIDPASTISYTGTMNIDNSVHCIIYSTVDAYGVYFHSNVVGDTTINGVFTISFSSGSSADAYGVSFFETVSGDTTINGVFIISSSISAYGTFFLGDVSGDTTINGVFTISSADVHGVLFVGDVSGDTTINGVFTIYANNAYGTFFLGDVSGDTTINGVFTIISIYSPTGVYFNSTISGDTTINGIFTISSSSSASASGVYFECTPTGELSGVPNFYSNKVDSGDWTSEGGTEYWNGGTNPNVGDSSLELQSIYDTPTDDGANFHVEEISVAGVPGSLTNFNTALRNALQNYVDQSDPSIATSWLNNIISKISIT